ncbi:flagellar motor switch protein FliG [Calditerricola satsumensis]|uniref:Flagellar motor switch protein FliG n=1 Tax=Calditerricola satsumensis TaxID=373054 RepID=A0A8J3F9R7_9BACI|nr:flagellar motor switch protein FliG [Calditerricola satsumensis]GGJ97927.1 flagellar motor switch protein FliG [Calditerricola satsumensis]
MARRKHLSGLQKAAILLISLGSEVSARIFQHLTEEEIEQLTLEIASMRKVDPEEKEAVLAEFQEMARAQAYIEQGGILYAKQVLEQALGEEKALRILNRLTANLQVRPFDTIRKADPGQVLNFLQNEHPQTIALVLSYLQPEQAAVILSALPPASQADIARRIALMDRASPEVISQVEHILEQKLAANVSHDYLAAGGIEAIVAILNRVDRATERTILDTLEVEDPDLVEEIKKRMFVFEDIVTLDDRSIQRVIREVDQRDLQLALKVASEEVREAIFRNMSKRMAEAFREELEYMGPVRLRDVEEAQSRIVAVIRRLEEAGEVIISRGGGDEIVV